MSHKGKVQLTIIFTAAPDLVEEGDRIFERHAAWMAETHHREGDKALLRYDVGEGTGAGESAGPIVRTDGQHVLRHGRGVRKPSRSGRSLAAGRRDLEGLRRLRRVGRQLHGHDVARGSGDPVALVTTHRCPRRGRATHARRQYRSAYWGALSLQSPSPTSRASASAARSVSRCFTSGGNVVTSASPRASSSALIRRRSPVRVWTQT